MADIVARRLVCFDSLTWAWAQEQENLSQAIRKLILAEICTFKAGRPVKEKLYIPQDSGSVHVSDNGGGGL